MASTPDPQDEDAFRVTNTSIVTQSRTIMVLVLEATQLRGSPEIHSMVIVLSSYLRAELYGLVDLGLTSKYTFDKG